MVLSVMAFHSTHMLSSVHRLTKRKDFDTVFKRGRAATDRALFLKFAKTTPDQPLRAAFVISTKTAKSAVKRNRARRQAREAFRALLPRLAPGFDLVITIKASFLPLSFAEKSAALEKLLKKARLL